MDDLPRRARSGAGRPAPSARIRPAQPEDAEELAELEWRNWSTVSEVHARPHRAVPFFDQRHRQPRDYLVAVDDWDRVLGYVRVAPATPLPANSHVRQIQGLVVDRECRRRGLGRMLVEAACEEARRRGARRLSLRVLGHNVAARRLYESCGFEVEGVQREEFLLDGRYVDDVLMARFLAVRPADDPGPSSRR